MQGYTGGAYSNLPGSETARDFYRQLLHQKQYWERTWRAESAEGLMKLELPHAEDTDGRMLQDFAVHSVIKDMITRRGTIHPKYGVVPQTYGMVGAGGFQAIFVDTLTMALELGASPHARFPFPSAAPVQLGSRRIFVVACRRVQVRRGRA